MKIGDKIRIIKSGLVGVILDETASGWKIDFLNGKKPVLISKSTLMEVIAHSGGDNGGYQGDGSKPKKRKNWKDILWIIGAILFIAAAVYITLINVL